MKLKLKKFAIVVFVMASIATFFATGTRPVLAHEGATSVNAKNPSTMEMAQITHPCTRRSVTVNGKAWGLVTGVQVGLSVDWCYDPQQGPLVLDRITTTPHGPRWNAWGSAASWTLWSYKGVTNIVKGSGTNCAAVCWEYIYRRYYYTFERGFKGVGQQCTVWVAMTIRGDGSSTSTHKEGLC